jgi:predicted ATPase/class 3 adenylate cyclase
MNGGDRQLPRGTVTLLFTDIEGSTRMLQELGREPYVRALTEHRRLLRETFTDHGGVEVEMQGDSFFFAFPYARDAVTAAVTAQRALADHAWESEPITVRIGLHTGEPMQADGLYAGLDVHHAARVMSAGHGGQILLSARTADLVTGELPDGVPLVDLGEHRLKDLTAPERLYQAGAGDFPRLKTVAPRSSLPVAATRLIGRERELEEVTSLLRGAARLVTVVGPGGAGKTRLALEASTSVSDHFADGTFWVSLTGLRDPLLVTRSAAQAVGADDDLGAYLEERHVLLVLDNFEHVLGAAEPLAHLLAVAPRLTALVTSRAPLRVAGEVEFHVDGLQDQDAVTLFLERARAAGQDLAADATVADICRRLDNLPLAIELGAARTKLFTPDALLQRLAQRLPLLTSGRRDAAEHQRTLRGTIAWSHELLDAAAQALLARLSVFAGSFSVEAAETVCDADMDTLTALVDLSLLKSVAGDRFVLLETVREFAAEHLTASQADLLGQRHSLWFADEAERGEIELVGPNQRAWLHRLEAGYDDVRKALADRPAEEIALRIAAAMGVFWRTTSYVGEGRQWLDRVLAHGRGPTRTRARALGAAAELAILQDDYPTGRALLTDAEALFREAADAAGRAEVLARRAWLYRLTDDLPRAGETIDDALVLLDGHDEKPLRARVLRMASVITFEAGEPERARRLAEEALTLRRELGDEIGIAVLVSDLALRALYSGDVVVARAHGEESLSLLGEASPGVAAATQHTLAVAALALDDVEAAQDWLRLSLETYRGVRDVLGMVSCLELAAALASRRGNHRESAVVAAAAARAFAAGELSEDEIRRIRPLYEQHLARARTDLSENEWEAASARGASLSLEDASDLALGLLDAGSSAAVRIP